MTKKPWYDHSLIWIAGGAIATSVIIPYAAHSEILANAKEALTDNPLEEIDQMLDPYDTCIGHGGDVGHLIDSYSHLNKALAEINPGMSMPNSMERVYERGQERVEKARTIWSDCDSALEYDLANNYAVWALEDLADVFSLQQDISEGYLVRGMPGMEDF